MIEHCCGCIGKTQWADLDTHKITSKEIDEIVRNIIGCIGGTFR